MDLGTALPAPLRSGASAIAAITVVAPNEIGRHRVRFGVVHEDVRWLDIGIEVELEIVPCNQSERNVPRRIPRRFGLQRIPRLLHRIWLGPEPLPEEQRAYGEGWTRHHPRWEHLLWRDDDLEGLGLPAEAVARAPSLSAVSDLVRHRILVRFGGVYIDTDMECLRPLDPLLKGLDFFAGFEAPGVVGTAIFGARQDHAVVRRTGQLIDSIVGLGRPEATGPPFFTHVLWDFPNLTIYPQKYFFPYPWSEPGRRSERFDDAYAVHHWAMSWRQPSMTGNAHR